MSCLLLLALLAQDAPREKPEDYSVRAAIAKDWTLGAEFLARSVPVADGVLFSEDYVVIEVKFFGPVGKPIATSPAHFSLTLDAGKKAQKLQPETASLVAASMRDSIFNAGRPNLTAQGQIGNGPGVIVGGRRPTVGAPDIDGRRRGPAPPQAPDTGPPPKPPIDLGAAVANASLGEYERKPPTGGLLYFAYRGKLKAIKSMVLHYKTETAASDLKLIP